MTTEARCYAAGFEAERRDYELRNARNTVLKGGKGKEMDSPLGPPERAWLFQYLDFGPVILILHF